MFDKYGMISNGPAKGCDRCEQVFSKSFNSSEPMVKVIPCKDCENKNAADKEKPIIKEVFVGRTDSMFWGSGEKDGRKISRKKMSGRAYIRRDELFRTCTQCYNCYTCT